MVFSPTHRMSFTSVHFHLKMRTLISSSVIATSTPRSVKRLILAAISVGTLPRTRCAYRSILNIGLSNGAYVTYLHAKAIDQAFSLESLDHIVVSCRFGVDAFDVVVVLSAMNHSEAAMRKIICSQYIA
jgi:hypothetical protein